jgi:hypothetical protein
MGRGMEGWRKERRKRGHIERKGKYVNANCRKMYMV